MAPAERVKSPEELQIAEYDRVKTLALTIVRAGGPFSYIEFSRIAEILELEAKDFVDYADKTEMIAAMMHKKFGTDPETVKGIGHNNEYLGYHKEYSDDRRNAVDVWDFMPLFNHPYIRMTVVENGDDAGIRLSEIDKEADKIQLRLGYRDIRNLARWTSSGEDSGVVVDDDGGDFPVIDRKTRFPRFDDRARRKTRPPKKRNELVQGALDLSNADNTHAEQLHEDYAEVHKAVKTIVEVVGKYGSNMSTSQLLDTVQPLYDEQFEPEDMIDLLRLILGTDDKKAVNGRVAPYLLVDMDWNYTKKTGLVVEYKKWTFIPISGNYMVEFTPYSHGYSGANQKIDQVQIDVKPVKNYGKLITRILETRGKPDPKKMGKKAYREHTRRIFEEALLRSEEERLANLVGEVQVDFLAVVDIPTPTEEDVRYNPDPSSLVSLNPPLGDYEQSKMPGFEHVPVAEGSGSKRKSKWHGKSSENIHLQPALMEP